MGTLYGFAEIAENFKKNPLGKIGKENFVERTAFLALTPNQPYRLRGTLEQDMIADVTAYRNVKGRILDHVLNRSRHEISTTQLNC